MLAGLGMRFEDIALIKGVCVETLHKYAGEALKRGKAKAKAQIMQGAYKMALSGKHPALTIFWLKTQCGWRERGVDDHSHPQRMHPAAGSRLVEQLSGLLQSLAAGQLEAKVASSVASLANALLKAQAQQQFSERLTALELALKAASENNNTGSDLELDEGLVE